MSFIKFIFSVIKWAMLICGVWAVVQSPPLFFAVAVLYALGLIVELMYERNELLREAQRREVKGS